MSDAALPAARPNAVRAQQPVVLAERAAQLVMGARRPKQQVSLLLGAQPEQDELAGASAVRASLRAPAAWRESRSARRQASKYETDQSLS